MNCTYCNKAEVGRLPAQDQRVEVLGFVGQTVATKTLVSLYGKSSHRDYVSRKARLGSHGIVFTKTDGQL